MQHVFWLEEGRLAGRPGPNLYPWNVDELRRGGIRCCLSVNDGELVHPEDFARADMPYRCVALADNAPPRPGDHELCLRQLPKALSFALAAIERHGPVLVHCRQGKDRTGLFMAYYLHKVRQLAPEAAIALVHERRPSALGAEGWKHFALSVLRASDETLAGSLQSERDSS